MTVYFQHVGERGGARDFPRTIGTPEQGLKRFAFPEIEEFLDNLDPDELERLLTDTKKYAPEGFQIWGIPSGAKSVLRSMAVGDYLLLLYAVGPGGTFAYGGRVIATPSKECFTLSNHLWGEQRFPLIVFLKGGLTDFSWYEFCDRLGYSRSWNPAGNTYRTQSERIATSVYADEDTLVRHIVGIDIPLEGRGPTTPDHTIIDPIELDIASEEGRRLLREHIIRERSGDLVRQFKGALKNFNCAVCGFSFEKAYGPLGRAFLEAHHIKPVAKMAPGEKTRLSDLVGVCSNCHRMLHRRSPMLSTDELADICAKSHVAREGG